MKIEISGELQVGLSSGGSEVYVAGMDLGDILKAALPTPPQGHTRPQITVTVTVE